MNQKSLKTLEFYKITEQLSRYASSPMGKERCQKLLPMEELSLIELAQTETSDALTQVYQKGSLSFSGLKDIRPSLAALDIGASLGITELLSLCSVLEVCLRAKTYGRNNGDSPSDSTTTEETEQRDSLTDRFEALAPLSGLQKEIRRCIISEDTISDEASPGLKHVRRSIKTTNSRIHEQLNQIVNSNRSILQDALVTMRNGRYCLPVRAEYKSQFPGMVHDQSSSGSTLFMEPMSVVKLNNELTELALKEQEEIQKVLANLSNEAAGHLVELKTSLTLLCELEFIFAKAMLAKEMKATRPVYNTDGIVEIKKGRHPLIDAKKVVPIDVRLGDSFDLLVITGPNTGGKTVTLKTVGLFSLMGQAGLHIPAFDGSRLSVFPEIFADIGDEQSIEQSLSTFSSHMTNTVSILKEAKADSLCLFDELGAGTDPTEGAALAIAILESLHQQGIRTIATTHYSELKVYALSTDGVENACCEFDVATLRPTYRLLIGIPGKSNAFAISSRLGLPSSIIEDARRRIDEEDQSFEDVISELNESRTRLQKEESELAAYKAEVEDLKKKLAAKNERIDQAKDKILRRASEEAREILENAKSVADDTIRKYNKWAKDSNLNKEMEKERQNLRSELNKTESRLSQKKTAAAPSKKLQAKDIKVGDSVRILSMNLTGTVKTLPDKRGNLEVLTGILTTRTRLDDLALVSETTVTAPGVLLSSKKERKAGKNLQTAKAMNVHAELNLIGMKVAEALPVLEKYLDDAYLARLGTVSIIHGFGTGALKNAVHEQLKATSYVKSFRLGGPGEGSGGSTIVTFT